MAQEHVLVKTVSYGPGGWVAEVYTDDDNASGYGEHPQIGYWYGSRQDLEALDPATVPLHPYGQGDCPDGPDRTDPGYWLDNF